MFVRSLSIQNIRNHELSTVEFVDGTNIITGDNGAGKTTILEALSICAFTKTFLPTSDAGLIRHGAENYRVACHATTDLGNTYDVSVAYQNSKKLLQSTHGNNLSPKDIIGEIPMVILSPDFKSITFGSPADRRSFLDRLLSQCSRRYYEELSNLRRILKQRNYLLSTRTGYLDKAQSAVWTEQLITVSAELTLRRRDFIQRFLPFLLSSYSTLSLGRDEVSVRYLPDVELEAEHLASCTLDDLEHHYRKHAAHVEDEEQRRGMTLWGPQKDDLEIHINGGRARDVASQGQHKSLLICLKKAEFEFLREVRAETPILLLDDIFSELDEVRTSRVFETVISSARQCFITTTEPERIQTSLPSVVTTRTFNVIRGTTTIAGSPTSSTKGMV